MRPTSCQNLTTPSIRSARLAIRLAITILFCLTHATAFAKGPDVDAVSTLGSGEIHFAFDLLELEYRLCEDRSPEPWLVFERRTPPHQAQPILVTEGCCTKPFFEILDVVGQSGEGTFKADVRLGGICTTSSQLISLSCGDFTVGVRLDGELPAGTLAPSDAETGQLFGSLETRFSLSFREESSGLEFPAIAELTLEIEADYAIVDRDATEQTWVDADCDGVLEDEPRPLAALALGWRAGEDGPIPGSVCASDALDRAAWCASP